MRKEARRGKAPPIEEPPVLIDIAPPGVSWSGEFLEHVKADEEMRKARGLNRLRFLVSFIQQNLDALRPGEKTDLLDTLSVFANGLVRDIARRMPRISLSTAKELQGELRAGFQALRQQQIWKIKGLSVDRSLGTYSKAVRGRTVVAHGIGSHYRSRDPRSGFLMQAWDILETIDFNHIRDCAFCGRTFVATKRQIYCSPACSQRMRMRRYLDRHTGELRRRRRQAYERRQKQRLGAKVKIGRRSTEEG